MKTKKIASFLSLFTIFTALLFPVVKLEAEPIKDSCSAYLVAEANSGEILDSLEADTPRPPASMAKLMTAYVILKKIKEGSLSMDDNVTISAEASKIGGSQVYLKQGEVFTIKELLNALLIQSANDAALALAQHVSGSRESFIEEMNQSASEIGMKHASFQSPHGLPPGKDQLEDLLAPSDFLVLGRTLVQQFPEILEITSKQIEPFRNGSFEMRNHNGLLQSFEGTDGLKTGFYNEAGFCVTTTAKRKGVRLIAVLMGCPSRKTRDQQATELLAKGFGLYKTSQIVKSGEAITNQKIEMGLQPEVALVTKESISAPIRIGKEQEIERRIKPCGNLIAPVAKGTVCGTVEFIRSGLSLGSSQLIVNDDVQKAGIVKRILGKFGLF